MSDDGSKESYIAKVLKHRNRFGELAIGVVANKLIDHVFDWILYRFVIYRYGILLGGIVMIGLSFIACLLSVWFYDWAKRDWLGIEAIKSMKEYDGNRKIGQLVAWILNKSNLLAVMILSVQFDPFITMVYMRNGAYNGMSARDWRVFIASLIFGNVYWILACFMGVSLVEWAWKTITGIAI